MEQSGSTASGRAAFSAAVFDPFFVSVLFSRSAQGGPQIDMLAASGAMVNTLRAALSQDGMLPAGHRLLDVTVVVITPMGWAAAVDGAICVSVNAALHNNNDAVRMLFTPGSSWCAPTCLGESAVHLTA